ncbi:MAG: hypothetical protein RL735_1747 [Pseudomonadota bacterium]
MIEGMKSLYVVSLCPTETDQARSNILPFAISLAQQARAHLSIEMAAMRIVVPSAGPSSTISGLVTSENRRLLGISQEYARQAHADASAAGVPATAQPVHLAYSDFVARMPHRARVHDLTILSSGASLMEVNRGFVETALFEGAHPVLIAPPDLSTFTCRKVVVAWDGSMMASRAVTGALPLLRVADQVEVISVQGEKDLSRAIPGTDVAEYLSRHNVKVTLKDLTVGSGGVAQTLREQMQMSHADLLVMGSYKHSRLREWVLGGVTASLLEECETPLFMAH